MNNYVAIVLDYYLYAIESGVPGSEAEDMASEYLKRCRDKMTTDEEYVTRGIIARIAHKLPEV